MAVFTPVSGQALEHWLAGFDLGALRDLQGIASGIENSNFFVDTTRGRYVLTLFERLSATQVPFYLGLMRHLAARGVPCPDPVADRQGRLLGELAGRPAALVTRLTGASLEHPSLTQCARLGAVLAAMHAGAADYPQRQPNPRGPNWWQQTAPQVMPFLNREAASLLTDEMECQRQFGARAPAHALPGSAVHADLFRDNVLFDGDRVGGVIDFYFAGDDAWAYDLAVVCNDWCIDLGTGAFEADRLDALLGAYRAVRPPLPGEINAWPMMLRAAALRFWVSRLFDFHLPRPAQLVTPKDPSHFERVLRRRRAGAPTLA